MRILYESFRFFLVFFVLFIGNDLCFSVRERTKDSENHVFTKLLSPVSFLAERDTRKSVVPQEKPCGTTLFCFLIRES